MGKLLTRVLGLKERAGMATVGRPHQGARQTWVNPPLPLGAYLSSGFLCKWVELPDQTGRPVTREFQIDKK